MTKPIAVLISDVHYNLQTLELADAAMRQAILRANTLDVKLIVAGDLHDSKANLRAECVNRMIETFKLCKTEAVILRGNHCSLHEKSEEHALNFLSPYATILAENYNVIPFKSIYVNLIPYNSDVSSLKQTIARHDSSLITIMHQGVIGSNSGEYLQDKSAILTSDVAGLRVVSGHYHTRQTINLPNGGEWDYIGSPFTLNFAEANDPEKGYQILMSDGALEFVPTNLRKHVIIDITQGWNETDYKYSSEYKSGDILKVRYHCRKEHSQGVTKRLVQRLLDLPLDTNFQLELDIVSSEKQEIKPNLTQHEVLDKSIDQLDVTEELKTRLKKTWRQM